MTTKLHTIYKNKDGMRVPSVTTVLGILNKPYLLNWVAEVTRNGEDWTKVRDSAGGAGTLAHAMVLANLQGKKLAKGDMTDCSSDTIKLAGNSFDSFLEWKKEHQLEPVLLETPLICNLPGLEYGGTMDFYGRIDGKLTVMDFKTGKGLYDEYSIQLAAYGALLIQNGYEGPDVYRLLKIGREKGKDFEEKVLTDIGTAWQIFKNCLSIYNLQKQMKGETNEN